MSYIISRPWGGACGVGHQFHNWLTGWLLSRRYDLQFIHSPFCGTGTQVQIDQPVEKWESFLGLGLGHTKEQFIPKEIKRVSLPKVFWDESNWETVTVDHPDFAKTIAEYQDQHVVFECARDQFVAMNWDLLCSMDLKARFWQANTEKLSKHQFPETFDKTNIAIHIRRGDVTETGRYKVRWVGLSVYMKIMNQIARTLGQDIVFHIFSDATDRSDFQLMDCMDYDTKFYLWGSDIFDTFLKMTQADILVTGQSMFSSLAGILSDGIVLARPWSPHWSNFPQGTKTMKFIELGQNGNFDTNRLKELSCT